MGVVGGPGSRVRVLQVWVEAGWVCCRSHQPALSFVIKLHFLGWCFVQQKLIGGIFYIFAHLLKGKTKTWSFLCSHNPRDFGGHMARLADTWGLAAASDTPTEARVVGVGAQMCSQTFRTGALRVVLLGLPCGPTASQWQGPNPPSLPWGLQPPAFAKPCFCSLWFFENSFSLTMSAPSRWHG